MKRMAIICLVLILLTSQACSTEVANTQVLTLNGQQTNRNSERREVNENLTETNADKEQQVVQTDKTSIKGTKGLIVLSDRYRKNEFVRFYNEDESLWYEFTFFYDDSDGKFDYENENFLPFAFHPDYFSLALKCVGEDKNRYEVIVNEETGLKKFVKKNDPTLKFQTWEDHITKAFAVDFNRNENHLRETPQGKIKTGELPSEVTFHPVKMEGDWLKVSWDVAKQGDNAGSGWIKWKENQKLLIELSYFS
ncbi:MAG: hypothetical protein JSS81_18665 [Acidobacteria bacterium]|nr:hypothetical protein [Acidobacteriota bacterium]